MLVEKLIIGDDISCSSRNKASIRKLKNLKPRIIPKKIFIKIAAT